MQRKFFTLDVFTERPFAGNPLAVVTEPEGLDTATMQAIAREFNFPETVFVHPPDNVAHRARLRIFTPTAELVFAGHPTVGTAVLLAHLDGAAAAQDFVVEEKIGPVACRAVMRSERLGEARFDVPSLPVDAGKAPDAKEIAAAVSLAPEEIGFDGHAPARWSTGMAFTYVPVRSRDALAQARPDPARFEPVLGIDGPGKVYLYCAQTSAPDIDYRVRMFAPGMGIPEDPATGSAAASFAGLLASRGMADGDHSIRIEQGLEMGRPSLIALTVTMRGGRLAASQIGGGAVIVMEGRLEA